MSEYSKIYNNDLIGLSKDISHGKSFRVVNNKIKIKGFGLRQLFSTSRSNLKDLPVALKVLEKNSDPQEFKVLLESLRERVVSTFGKHDVYTLLERNDLLEALAPYWDDLPEEKLKSETIRIQRIAAPQLSYVAETFHKNDILLVARTHLSEVNKVLSNEAKSLEEVAAKLKSNLEREIVPMGKAIDVMYNHEIGRSNKIHQLMTWFKGRKIKKENKPSAINIVRFFNGLNITPEVTLKGKVYAYSEIHPIPLRQEKSLDHAFQRGLTENAIQLHVKEAKQEQELVDNSLGKGKGSVIVSNSHCRMSLHKIPDKSKRRRFNITGKLLSDSADNKAAAKIEKSYTGGFSFSLQNLLGNEDEVETEITRPVVCTKENATQLLLDCTTNMLDTEELTMVVQRLAPEDIHHFSLPVNGRILSAEESAAAIKSRMERSGALSSDEKTQLELLEAYFKENPPAESTINIHGTQASVSRKALFKHSEILAQNDRKLLMMEHEDGSLSVHAYIGATAVNNVDVTMRAHHESKPMLTDVGSMGFGDMDTNNKDKWRQGLLSKEDSIGLRNLRGSNPIGASAGGFDQSGSTIVSVYFASDQSLSDDLEEFSDRGQILVEKTYLNQRIYNYFASSLVGRMFGMKVIAHAKLARNIEVKSLMGDVVALPAAYVFKKRFEVIDIYRNKSRSELVHDYRLSRFNRRIDRQIKSALDKEGKDLTPTEINLLAKFNEGLDRYFQ